ncbi:hypothetical protein OIO90_005778 [Microbotryomycetes sp. JL221]|nr:hypothetical protein OIO90_005778 [Microbotryomycetes sp. JL221]
MSKHGDNITIGCNAAKLLSRWGLHEEMWRASTKGGFWHFKDKAGHDLRTEDLRDYVDSFGSPMMQGSRARYMGILGTEARMMSVEFRLECNVIKYHDSAKSPSLETESGEIMFADVIVIADGIRSRSRDMLEQELQQANRTGIDAKSLNTIKSPYAIHRGLTDDVDKIRSDPATAYLLDGCARTWLGNDAHITVVPLENNTKLSFAFVHRDSTGAASLNWRDKRPITDVTKLLDDWDPSLKQAIATFRSCLNWQKTERPAEPQWQTIGGRIIFVGDAIHPLPPSSFQGGSQSVEDGAVLAICLALVDGRPQDISKALKAFQLLRYPHVKKALHIGMRQRQLWHTFVTSGRPESHLAFLVPANYDFDAEADALDNFEEVVRGFDADWRLSPVKRAKVARRLGFNKRAPPTRESLFPCSSISGNTRSHLVFQ